MSGLGLVSPESMLLTAPYTVGFVNGMTSLAKFGLTRCFGGFSWRGNSNCNNAVSEDYRKFTLDVFAAPATPDADSFDGRLMYT